MSWTRSLWGPCWPQPSSPICRLLLKTVEDTVWRHGWLNLDYRVNIPALILYANTVAPGYCLPASVLNCLPKHTTTHTHGTMHCCIDNMWYMYNTCKRLVLLNNSANWIILCKLNCLIIIKLVTTLSLQFTLKKLPNFPIILMCSL